MMQDDKSNDMHFSKDGITAILDACVEKTLGEVDKNNVFAKTVDKPKITGIAGDVIEQSVLGYKPNSYQEPDIFVDSTGVEVKTTGIRYSKTEKNKYEAKEPMSITAVSPEKITSEGFDTSNFWHKLEHMLIVYYLYDSEKTVPASEYAKFPIKGFEFHEFDDEDREALERDWLIVKDFIDYLQKNYSDYESQYPRLSHELRKDLLMIDTAPKWPNRPRFRLKRSVVTNIVQEYFGQKLEKLPNHYTSYEEIDLKCAQLSHIYGGKSISEIAALLNIPRKLENKSIGERVTIKMFGGKSSKMRDIDLFNKIGLIGKTIALTESGGRTEDMKLFPIDFDEIKQSDLKFEDSSFYEYFATHQFLCIIFSEPSIESPLGDNVFKGFKRYSFDNDFIANKVKPVWDKIRELVLENKLRDEVIYDKDGNPRINKNGQISSAPNLPKSSDGVIFVRGSGIDSSVKPEVVNGIRMYKQYVWIKGNFIADMLQETPFIA